MLVRGEPRFVSARATSRGGVRASFRTGPEGSSPPRRLRPHGRCCSGGGSATALRAPRTPSHVPRSGTKPNSTVYLLLALVSRLSLSVILSACLLTAMLACGGEEDPANARSSGSMQGKEEGPTGVPPDVTRCPVTLPNRKSPPGEEPGSNYYGNGRLWTGLWPFGVIVANRGFVQSDGSIRMKFFWWGQDVQGNFAIRGRRIDAEARPAKTRAKSGWPESGFTGDAFWSSAIIFPTEGCWEITGETQNVKLTFVTLVTKSSTFALDR